MGPSVIQWFAAEAVLSDFNRFLLIQTFQLTAAVTDLGMQNVSMGVRQSFN